MLRCMGFPTPRMDIGLTDRTGIDIHPFREIDAFTLPTHILYRAHRDYLVEYNRKIYS
jgi:hypothetical protein